MRRFFVCLLAVAAAMMVVARWGSPPSWDVEIVSFLLATHALAFAFLYPRRADPEKFTQLYLLSIVLKIVLSGAFAILFLKLDAKGAVGNIIFFLVAYLHFTGLEVIFLLVKSKPKKIS